MPIPTRTLYRRIALLTLLASATVYATLRLAPEPPPQPHGCPAAVLPSLPPGAQYDGTRTYPGTGTRLWLLPDYTDPAHPNTPTGYAVLGWSKEEDSTIYAYPVPNDPHCP